MAIGAVPDTRFMHTRIASMCDVCGGCLEFAKCDESPEVGAVSQVDE